jgi:hypothetical protein
VRVLYNSDLSFSQRLYGPLDVDLCRVKVHEPLGLVVRQSLLYVRDMLPKACFQAIVRLEEVSYDDRDDEVFVYNSYFIEKPPLSCCLYYIEYLHYNLL